MNVELNGVLKAVGLALCLGLAGPAQAALVQTTINSTVDFAAPLNPFGLSIGDTVTAVAVYDDVSIAGVGIEMIQIDSNPMFSLAIQFGAFSFVEGLDDSFDSGKPELNFNNGDFSGIDFRIDPFMFSGLSDLFLGRFANDTRWALDDNDSGDSLLEATWDFDNAVTVPFYNPAFCAGATDLVAARIWVASACRFTTSTRCCLGAEWKPCVLGADVESHISQDVGSACGRCLALGGQWPIWCSPVRCVH